MTSAHTLETPEVDIAYDVRGPLPTADGRPPLFMIGQPMEASGFATLASHLPDRTVVTYDPRGLGRSTRKDGRVVYYRLSHGFPEPLRDHCLRALVDLSRTVADTDDSLEGARP